MEHILSIYKIIIVLKNRYVFIYLMICVLCKTIQIENVEKYMKKSIVKLIYKGLGVMVRVGSCIYLCYYILYVF